MRKSRTHFEQIPLVAVKKIAEQEAFNDDAGTDHVMVEPPVRTSKQQSVPERSPRRKGR